MNNRTMMWVLAAAAAYFLLTKSSPPAAAAVAPTGGGQADPIRSGLNFDPLTGGYCYPPTYTGSYIGPYPNC